MIHVVGQDDVNTEEPDYQTFIQVIHADVNQKWTLCCKIIFCLLNRLSSCLVCRFVKNLSPDKINLSTWKGEGDLMNLELDEKLLTDLLELPNWLTLQKAWCNRVSIRIPWTKLKSVPICLVRCLHND